MSIPAWDASLPQRLLVKSYSESPADVLLRTSMDFGPAKVRRRGTAGPRPVSGSIIVTAAELATFKTFFNTTLLGGSLRFRWCDPIYGTSLSGVTANLSLANGLAFISNPSTDLSGYEYAKIIVTDSAGKTAVGYIKSAGTGETLDTEKIADYFLNWNNVSATLADGHYTIAGSPAGPRRALGLTVGAAYKLVMEGSSNFSVTVRNYNGGTVYATIATGSYSATNYFSAVADGTDNGIYLRSVSGSGTNTPSAFSLKQLLTPSATGVTITSTRGGTTYNWTEIESGFNYNSTSYDIAIYATEMRFTKTPSWQALGGDLFEIALELEILP